ncbi:MAG TPA: LLM class flavin-dependent oxidoreductase [Mycobacteriales bacterium]|nr:LLM class flavin-dependent oxidoreductase [Mycobacteriales bacterium]
MSGRRAGLPWPGAEVAAEAEAAGVAAFCTGEFADHDAYVTTTQMAVATTAARIGPGIAYAFSRTPFAHAAALRQLHKIAGDRLFVGLGSGAFRINRDWFGVAADRPLARMSELVQVLRAYLHAENGERIRFAGEFYAIDANVQAPVLGRLDIPVLIGAFNAKMCAATGRFADGVIGHGLFTTRWWDEVVRPSVAEGAQAAGRDAAELVEHGWVITAIDDDDPARAVDDARKMIGFYLTVKTYDPMVELLGWGDAVAEIRASFARGDMAGLAGAVTEEMVEQVAVCGTTADATEMLRAKGDGLARDVVFLAPPSFLVSERRRAAYARRSLALLPAL